ncbi:MAG TPA: 16S rRNA (guanine(527)-N(7))-methyltransferase RsmG [Bacilli bacterium]|nr:16S rRNA (guanine(527)-N(7))-methyltransferase RsmG [Bacilli bacterium]
MNETEFKAFLVQNKIIFDDTIIKNLAKYCDFLLEYNKKFNLTSITTREEIYLKHFADSILLMNYIKFDKELVDVGTGAGFPGIIIKIFNKNLKLCLIESNNKKCQFLQELIKELNLTDVKIINTRAEKYSLKNLDKYEIVVSRAVADLKILTELCLPLVKIGGKFIAMKGKTTAEIENSQKTIQKLNGTITNIYKYKLPIVNHDRSIVEITKKSNTPKGYPRDYSKIIKSY